MRLATNRLWSGAALRRGLDGAGARVEGRRIICAAYGGDRLTNLINRPDEVAQRGWRRRRNLSPARFRLLTARQVKGVLGGDRTKTDSREYLKAVGNNLIIAFVGPETQKRHDPKLVRKRALRDRPISYRRAPAGFIRSGAAAIPEANG